MALQTTRIDDLTGEPDATSVVITVNGKGVEIDLGAASAAKLTKALDAFWRAGTEADFDVVRRQPGKARRAPSDVDPKLVRAWADANGIEVGRQGRVPKAIVDQYLRS